jgi:hypothetical protein
VIRRGVLATGLGPLAPRSSVVYHFSTRVFGLEFIRTARP